MVTPYRVCREIRPNGRYTFNISPPSSKRANNDENEETPELCLESFQRPPFVNFGKVIIGTEITKSFIIYNPADVQQKLKISKLPKPEDGFVIDNVPITLDADQRLLFNVTWRPSKLGGVRSKVHFVTSFNEKFEVTLLGTAAEKERLKRRAKPRRRVLIPTLEQASNNQPTCVERKKHQVSSNDQDQKLNLAACKIQKWWRMHLKERKTNRRETFLVDVPYNVALTIQKHWRAYKARKNFAVNQKQDILTVEQKYNSHDSLHIADNPALLSLQTFNKICTESCSNFTAPSNVDEISNSQWSCTDDMHQPSSSERELKLNLAACKIQKWWRSCLKQRTFSVDVRNNAALTIQKYWRAYKARKNFALMIQKKQDVVPTLHNYTSQDSLHIKDNPTLPLGFRTDVEFVKLIDHPKCCQSQAALSYLETTINIPSEPSCEIASSSTLDGTSNSQSSCIDSQHQGILNDQDQKIKNLAAINIQKWWRSYLKQRKTNRRDTFLVDVQHNVSLTTHKLWKAYEVSANYDNKHIPPLSYLETTTEMSSETFSKITSPSKVYGNPDSQPTCVERQKHQDSSNDRELKLNLAACKIQRWWRAKLERKFNRRDTFLIDFRYNAALTIQKHWKAYKARVKNVLQENSLIIQKHQDIEPVFYNYINQDSLYINNNSAYPSLESTTKICTESCSNFTAPSNVDEISNNQWSCTDDMHQPSSSERELKLNLAACKIQKWWRSCLKQRTFSVDVRNNAALTIQKYWRAYKARKNFALVIQKKQDVVTTLHNYTSQDSLHINNNSPLLSLETTTEISPESCSKTASLSNVVGISNNQSANIDNMHQENTSDRELKLDLAVCKIQKWWRSHLKQRKTNRRDTFSIDFRYKAALTIQKHWKEYKSRGDFTMMISKKQDIVPVLHNYTSQDSLHTNNNSPLLSLETTTEISPEPSCEIASSSTLDGTSNSQSSCIDNQHQGILNDQDQKIKNLAAIKIQKWWRSYLKQRTFSVDFRYNAALTIQKHWRAYKVRKNFALIIQKKQDIVPVLHNYTSQDSLHIKDNPALPLGFRTDVAFKKLVNYRKFCQLQAALSSLETTTKISPESCCKIASSSTVDTILDIIRRSNRSEPSKLVISHAFSILLNLIKFEKTQDLVVDRSEVTDICFEKAKVHNKVESIFCKCLTLIYLMVVKSSDRDTIISDPKVNKNLKSLIALEASFIRSHKKHKISKEIVFYPYWSSAKNVIYEFTDRFTALEHVNYIFKSKLF